jgi:malate synthase
VIDFHFSIHNLMEDAATAEISRSQLWQWVRHNAQTKEGKTITPEWITQMLDEELNAIKSQIGEKKYSASKFPQAKNFLAGTIKGGDYSEFLTVS